MVETASWLAVAVAVVGLVAEILHRAWKAKDKAEEKHEQAHKDRDGAWANNDPGGVFNDPED